AYQELKGLERLPRSELSIARLTDWTMRAAALVRGSIEATLLRNDGWDFLNLGYALERADNTARLLDVKYYVLLPRVDYVGSGLDNYQWTTLLRAMSVHRAFHWAYGGEVTAAKIAHFLILNPQCPRALITCAAGANTHLERLARGYGSVTAAQRQGHALLGALADLTVEEVFDEGLHEFLTRIIGEVSALGATVHETYLSGDQR
ncbi:MAG: alpha-E domain-containing protein, partial [Gemmobacter sp.]